MIDFDNRYRPTTTSVKVKKDSYESSGQKSNVKILINDGMRSSVNTPKDYQPIYEQKYAQRTITPRYRNDENRPLKKTSINNKAILKIMDQQIKSVRDEFIGALNDISNKNDSRETINEKVSNLDFTATANSNSSKNDKNLESGYYGILDNSKRTDKRNSDVKSPFYFGRSTSAQETHKTLFYKHAFTEKEIEKEQKLENLPQDTP